MEIKFNNYKIDEKTIIKLVIEHKKITGLTGSNNDKLIELLTLNINNTNNIQVNDINITNKNLDAFKKRIELVEEDIESMYYQSTIRSIMVNKIINDSISLEDSNKKMIDSLKIVGLTKDYLDRNIQSLSGLEKKLVLLSISLLSNPSMLVIKEPFKDLDLYNKNKLIRFYNKIKERYQKTIIFISDNSDMLYNNTEMIIYAKNNRIIEETKTDDFYNNISALRKNKIDIPHSVELINYIKQKKKIKLTNYKDVRDILKDIYKHV